LGAVRFSPNEWLVALYGTNPPAELFDEYHQRIARWMEVQYSRVLAVGIDIILETAVKADENDVDVQKQAGF
jgi:sporulation protein YlmC with PRC-barrel domain